MSRTAERIAHELAADYDLDELFDMDHENEAEEWEVNVSVMTKAIEMAIDMVEDAQS